MLLVIRLSDAEYKRICEDPGSVNPQVNYAVRAGVALPEEMNMYTVPGICEQYLNTSKKG